MAVELVSPATPLETGDAALVSRDGDPAMVVLGTAAEKDVSFFAASTEIAAIDAELASVDSDLTALETDRDLLKGVSPAAAAGSEWVSDGSGSGSFIRIRGWGQYGDNRTTSGSPTQAIATGVRTKWICNGAGELIEKLPSDAVAPLWNTSTNVVAPVAAFDTMTLRVAFRAQGYAGSTPYITVELDIGGGIGVIWSQTVSLLKAGSEQFISLTIPVYTGSTFLANGGSIYLTYTGTGSCNIYSNQIFVRRESKNYV